MSESKPQNPVKKPKEITDFEGRVWRVGTSKRVVRGGTWYSLPRWRAMIVNKRPNRGQSAYTDDDLNGFRIARTKK